MLWSIEQLCEEGKKLNEYLKDDFLKYCGGNVQLDVAVAYACLVIANSSHDTAKKDDLVALLQGKTAADEAAYKSLRIRRWSPVKKAIEVFAPIVQAENTPDLDTLLDQQSSKHANVSPSWATLMPDKMYAIALFWRNEPTHRTGRLQSPFGKAVQAAYSVYSGVQIRSQPTPTHHQYLHGFERSWSDWGGCDVLDINSGLHQYGLNKLL